MAEKEVYREAGLSPTVSPTRWRNMAVPVGSWWSIRIQRGTVEIELDGFNSRRLHHFPYSSQGFRGQFEPYAEPYWLQARCQP